MAALTKEERQAAREVERAEKARVMEDQHAAMVLVKRADALERAAVKNARQGKANGAASKRREADALWRVARRLYDTPTRRLPDRVEIPLVPPPPPPRKGTMAWYAAHGTPLLQCPRCKHPEMHGRDSDDEGHVIICDGCGLTHYGTFGSDAARDWNAGRLRCDFIKSDEITYFPRDPTPVASPQEEA